MKARIGGVPYGVGAPLLAGLAGNPEVELLQLPPAQLIEPLRRGDLDAALLSSIEAIRHPGYRVVADIGIACKHEIRSVRAFRRPGAPIRSVGLDRSSATSTTLLQLLLNGPRKPDTEGPIDYTEIAPTRRPGDLPHDLMMLIGDDGLHADATGLETWDLGSEWRQWTGLPFVFALWLLPRQSDPRRIVPLLRQARQHGHSLRTTDGTHGAVHYDLDQEDIRGLHRFWQDARTAGLGRRDIEPELVTETLEGASE